VDLRLFARTAAPDVAVEVARLAGALAAQARRTAGWPMPGYTHMQRAQPVTTGHHLLAHAEPLLRDLERFRQAHESAGEMPLGAGALAASTLPLQRDVVARELGFSRLTRNSMDAVSDRDFLLDLVFACAVTGLHLSRLAEDLVLWSSAEFGFVRLADEISTGSSLMPQKRNPDIAELLRGRAGRPVAALNGLFTILKGLPLAYDRDLQEDKVHTFAAVDNVMDSAQAARLMVESLVFDAERMREAAADADLYATDIAEEMVRGGAPFRDAHRQVGRRVLAGEHAAPWGADESLRRRSLPGGPHPDGVRREAARAAREARRAERWAVEHRFTWPHGRGRG
jgi:argininosuccinate lyase